MKQQWKLILCLALAAVTLSACNGQQTPQNSGNNSMIVAVETQFLGPTATPALTQEPIQVPINAGDGGEGTTGNSIFSANPYDMGSGYSEADPLNEENYVDPGITGDIGITTVQAEGTVYPFAGSTPIPLNPVDMPSPTPRAELQFVYATFTAGSLGLTFDAPSGWMANDSQTDVFVVTEPESEMHNGQQCVITISASPVNSNYSERELKAQVTQRLKDISAVNFSVWDPSLTASRYLMGSKGVYANYTGKLADGTELAGRIHYTCIENKLYGIEMMFPKEYRDDYLKVFSQIRESIKRQ